MKRNPDQQLKPPRVARHSPSLSKREDLNTEVYMFASDVQLAIMPIGGRRRYAPNFSAEIQGCSEQISLVTDIIRSLAERGRETHGTAELLCYAVDSIAMQLAWNGRMVCEVIRDDKNGEVRRLQNFTTRRLFRAFGRYIQLIPKADRGLWKKSHAFIPAKDIWEITMPRALGGSFGHRVMLRKLSWFRYMAPWLAGDLTEGRQPAYYNFQEHNRKSKMSVATITASWGWDHRESSTQNWTEFYLYYRQLQFKWAQACLREHIVKELNRLFGRLGIEAEVVVNGLPTTSDILEIRRQMCEGNISFDEAFNACSV